MQAFGLLCVLAYCFVATGVATRLLRLAARTGATPELTIGCGLLVGGAIGYPATVLSSLLAGAAFEVALRFAMAGTAALYLSAWAMLLAWQGIFHRGERWARWTTSAVSALLGGAMVEQLAGVALGGGGDANVARATLAVHLSVACQGTPYLLMAISGFRYHARLRRQLAIGLADPVVANRILLWSATAAVVVAQYVWALATLAHQGEPAVAAMSRVVIGSLGLVLAGLLWLAFFPPAAWLRRVRRRAPSAT